MIQVMRKKEEQLLTQEVLESISLFGSLTEEQLGLLLSLMELRECHAGERIFSEDDLPSSIYVLIKGRVDFLVKKKKVHCIQKTLGKGATFGESAVMGILRQPGTAIANADEVQLLVLTREALMIVQQVDMMLFGTLMMNLGRELSRKLHESYNGFHQEIQE